MERDRLKELEEENKNDDSSVDERSRMISVDSLVHGSVDSPLSADMALNTEFNFSLSDANLLYHDLNDIVHSRLEEALTPRLKTYIEETANPFNTSLMNEEGDDSLSLKSEDGLIFNVPMDYFSLGDPHKYYLSLYFDDFSVLSSPLMPNIGLNPVRDVLLNYAKKETYLLYAILACGARTAFRSSSRIEDDQAYCSYLSSCLNILSDHFADENLIVENVEPMMLTILFLTGDCASSKNVRWRAHLKGAKELFKKINIQSDILSFVRNWLISYEVLAGVTSPYGGIFQSDNDELDDFITNDAEYLKSLKRLNMIDIHGFNYISGHIIDLDLVFKEIIKMLNKMRKYKLQNKTKSEIKSHLSYDITPPIISLDKVEAISVQLAMLQEKEIIDKTGIIPPTNPNHPSQTSLFKNFESIETVKLKTGESVTFSWYDISHQSHIIAAKLVLLTKILEMRKTSILIQDLVSKALHFIRFLNNVDHYTNRCITHLNFVMVLIGPHCVKIEDQALVRKFLQMCRSMGLESAGHNLKKIETVWSKGDEYFSEDDEEDILTW